MNTNNNINTNNTNDRIAELRDRKHALRQAIKALSNEIDLAVEQWKMLDRLELLEPLPGDPVTIADLHRAEDNVMALEGTDDEEAARDRLRRIESILARKGD